MSTGHQFPDEIVSRLDSLMNRVRIDFPLSSDGRSFSTVKRLNQLIDDRQTYFDISNEYLKGYVATLYGQPDELTTHQLITRKAISLLSSQFHITASDSALNELVQESSGPDKNLSNMRLMMEGHFYGHNDSSSLGNYLPLYFNYVSLKSMQLFDDIGEDAKSNCLKHWNMSATFPVPIKYLGWALHYLQDMTAPHHVRNLPAYFPRMRGLPDTHLAFEKMAHEVFLGNENQFDALSFHMFANLMAKNPGDLSSIAGMSMFLDYVYQQSIVHANERMNNVTGWTSVINDAIPFAIACTMITLKEKLVG